jgi:hypothetical protein
MAVTHYEFRTWEKLLLFVVFILPILSQYKHIGFKNVFNTWNWLTWENEGLKLYTQDCSTSGEELWGWRSGGQPEASK